MNCYLVNLNVSVFKDNLNFLNYKIKATSCLIDTNVGVKLYKIKFSCLILDESIGF